VATPIGHSLAGITALAVGPRRHAMPLFLLAVVMANAPDLDFLPGLLVGQPALYHQDVTHSLGFAAAAALVGALVVRRLDIPFAAGYRVGLIAYASHLALDLLGPDSRPPFGIPLLWPLSQAHVLSPVTVLPGVGHAARIDASVADWLRGMLVARNVGAVAIETAVFAPLAWLVARRGVVPRPRNG
jgi:inner membrane protein